MLTDVATVLVQCSTVQVARLEQGGTDKHINDSIKIHTCIKLHKALFLEILRDKAQSIFWFKINRPPHNRLI